MPMLYSPVSGGVSVASQRTASGVTPATSAGSAAGSSATFYRTALSYIPESTWNDSTVNDTTISANVPWTGSYASIWGGSGGASKCSTNTSVDNSSGTVTGGSCTSGYS